MEEVEGYSGRLDLNKESALSIPYAKHVRLRAGGWTKDENFSSQLFGVSAKIQLG